MSGVITEVGKNVVRFKIGDAVFARPGNDRIGTLAEYIAVDHNEIALKPANISFAEAAGIPLVGLTSWQALIDVAKIGAGSKVFIQAGAGGIGSFAIQLAKSRGAIVATTTSQKNADLVHSLGADQVIDYKSQDFASVLNNQDVVFDTLGGEALYKSFGVVKPGGYVISISGDPDKSIAQEMNLGPIKSMILTLVGRKAHRLARKHGVQYRFLFMKPNGLELAEIAGLIESRKIMPQVDQEFEFNRVQEAIEYSESGRARGKIIVRIKP
jgi:alcohol dehydrogenase